MRQSPQNHKRSERGLTLTARSAPQLGKERRPGAGAERTPAQIETELRAVLANREQFPSYSEIEAEGGVELRRRIERAGLKFWRERVAATPSGRERVPPYWRGSALEDARRVLAAERHLPGSEELRERGLDELADVVAFYGGPERFLQLHCGRGGEHLMPL